MTPLTRVRTPAQGALALVQSEFRDYHPLVALARLAHRPDVTQDARLELEVHKAILPYVQPKLSSVDVQVSDPEDRRVIVSLFETRTLEDGRVVDVEVPLVTEVAELVPLDSD